LEDVIIVIILLTAVLVSGALGRALPWAIPLPLLQIGIGFLIARFLNHGITLDPELFFLLFLPPLLFLDGWRIPKDALRRDFLGIFQLSVGLVVTTVVGAGFIIHWMIPVMPLAVAFALAAIVSPTDAVAVEGITRHLSAPRRIVAILQGEALFNDASGLVAFRFAVAAAVTGAFSLPSASASFVWVALAGLAVGFILTSVAVSLRTRFNVRFGEDSGAAVLVSVLLPFGAYLLAEEIGASGILAAVAAGVMMSRAELTGRASAATRTQRSAVWNMLQFSLNGAIFILLGEQFPRIFESATRVAIETADHRPWLLVCYALAICLLLYVFRFLCIYASIIASRVLRRSAPPEGSRATFRVMLILTLGGVRGAVTLAGVMTLPLTTAGGGAFPARDLAIFLAAAVIVFSLLFASVSLPPLLRSFGVPSNQTHANQRRLAEAAAKDAAGEAIVAHSQSLEATHASLNRDALSIEGEHILAELSDTLGIEPEADTDRPDGVSWRQAREMRRTAVAAARTAIYRLAQEGQISDAMARDLVRRIDIEELRLS
jgi:monovalent cation/hydrogen antiporter